MPFPKGFLFGVATSAAQVEGGALEDGRGPSIWDTFASQGGRIRGGDTPAVACDSYRRFFDRDLRNLIALGVNSYRLSISWSRVLPDGTGALNVKGLDYYRRVIDALLRNGITPNVTLYHWDLPQALEDRGGWVNRDSVGWFGAYADRMFRALSDVVPLWTTVNEPIATYVGYAHGVFAPGHTNELWGNQARHHLLTAHGAAVEAFRALNPKGAQIGLVLDLWKRHALTDSAEDAALVRDEDERNWKFYCDPVFTGRYSDYILERLEREGTLMRVEPGDGARIAAPLDFFGLNVYNRVLVTSGGPSGAALARPEDLLGNGTEYYPRAVYDAVRLLRDLYGSPYPIYVTENGTYADGAEEVSPETGVVEDADRVRYLRGFLDWTERAIAEGFDIRGYYVWSLMDNFEWSAGTSRRFGLLSTDFETGETRFKRSAYVYRDFIRSARGGAA